MKSARTLSTPSRASAMARSFVTIVGADQQSCRLQVAQVTADSAAREMRQTEA